MKSTVGELAQLIDCEIAAGRGETPFEGGVSIDSRTLRRGDLFFAIAGPRHDGHDFVASAFERGAAGVVVARKLDVPAGRFALLARDTTRALQDLARGLRESKQVRVVAITGSMGKTTTKEAAACAIGSSLRVLRTEGNLNNEYGVPLTLLRLEDEEAAVLEMGMSSPGEIARLTAIARPDVGMVTNVAEVHLEFFRGLSEIAEAKGELFAGLHPGAVAVVNADDPLVLREARRFPGRKLLFGLEAEADLRASEIRSTPSGLRFLATRQGERVEVSSRLRGRHNVRNLLAGLAAASALEVPFADAAKALSRLDPARHRGERIDFGRGFVLVDETYNSSPRALAAALEALSEEDARRRIAVVGDMLELGERSAELHRECGRRAAGLGIDRLVAVGPLARKILEGALEAGVSPGAVNALSSAEEAGTFLAGELREGDLVLLKASRGVGLERALDSLRRAFQAAEE